MTKSDKNKSSRRWLFKMGKKHQDANSASSTNPSLASRRSSSTQDLSDPTVVADSLIDAVLRLLQHKDSSEPQDPPPKLQPSSQNSTQVCWTRDHVRDFVHSLPLRYALTNQDPQNIVLHMNMLESVQRNGHCSTSVSISSVLPKLFLSETEDFLINETGGQDSPSFSNSHRRKHTKAITIMCHRTVGLLEFIMGLWEAGDSEIFDCSVYTTTQRILLIQAIVQIKGGLKLDQLKEQIECFLRISTGLPVTHVNVPISARFGSPDPARVSSSHVHPDDQRDQVILDVENVGFQFFDPYDPLLDPDVQSDVACPEAIRKKRLEDAYLKHPTLLYDVIGFGQNRKKLDYDCVRVSREEKTESMDMSAGSTHSLGSTTSSSNNRRKLVRRTASIDLDQSISSHAISSFPSMVDALPRIMVTANIKASLPVRVFQGYLCSGDDDKLTHIFVSEKSIFENQPGLLAVKVAHFTDDVDSTKLLEDLAREADIAEHLDHINVCKLVLKFSSPEICMLGYEYCSKGSLCSILCDDTKTFDYLPLAMDIAQGMAYLHSKNIIHRDLKPSNIFVDRNNRAKIADFGMCAANTGDFLTGETGTYRWMSPEIIRHEPYSTKTDVYSFGICLWQLVTRCVQPFSDMNPIQAAYAVAKGVRPPIPYHVPDFIRQIIVACWDDDQLKRPTFANIYLGLSMYLNISQQQDYSI